VGVSGVILAAILTAILAAILTAILTDVTLGAGIRHLSEKN
jgi:hypothetical protein